MIALPARVTRKGWQRGQRAVHLPLWCLYFLYLSFLFPIFSALLSTAPTNRRRGGALFLRAGLVHNKVVVGLRRVPRCVPSLLRAKYPCEAADSRRRERSLDAIITIIPHCYGACKGIILLV